MSSTGKSEFVYVTYIRTTPERLWEALINPEFQKQYWFDYVLKTDWKPGSPWSMVHQYDGKVADSGEVLESEPHKRIVLKWRHEMRPELTAEGYARCVMELEPVEGAMKLTVTHSMERADSKVIQAVSGGWPRILSNLKSLLETGALVFDAKPKY
jgi:uncharacterized protein YndB with AHSA1/START domain